ncbi:MAG: YfhO family protein, partial [Thermoanaerobaculia bacterium]
MTAELRPLLLLAVTVPALWALRGRRREAGLAWLLAAAAATTILLPTLLVRHGVPSPSAMLRANAPWSAASATGAPAASAKPVLGNPELGDISFQVEPWLLYLRHELRAGRMPLWNPHQSSGAPYWSNGSSAPLFPLHLLFALLPIELGLYFLPWLRIAIGALGAYFLARELGIGRDGARLAAVVYPLSGRLVSFVLFPMANALCLVPWIFFAVERLAAGRKNGRGTWALLAALAGLQLLAGHPETAFFTAAACGIYLVARGGIGRRGQREARLEVWAKVVSAWFVGLLLSGVALVPLAFTVVQTDRWREAAAGGEIMLTTILGLWLRFVLPNAFGQATEGTFWGAFLFVPTTVYAGALTLPFAVAALWRRAVRDPQEAALDRRLRALAVMVVVCLLAAYHFPGVRELLLATPVVQKMLHHYLLLGVELGLALLAGAGLERWLAGDGRGLLYGALLPLAGLVFGWATFHDDWGARGQLGEEATATLLAIGLPLLVLAGCRLSPAARRRCAPLIVLLTIADLAWAHAGINPVLPVGELYARTPAVDFLAGRPERIAAVGTALRPNAAMALGLYDVRGDDSLKLSRYEKVYGRELATAHPTFFRPIEHWQSPWLDRLGVRWVLAPPGSAPPVAGWKVAYAGDDATVFDRSSAQPLVRYDDGSPSQVLARSPGRWEVAWPGAAEETARLVIAETWDAGWRATIDGQPLTVEVVDDLLLGVRPGAAPGRLVVSYVPQGLFWGLVLSGVGVAALLLGSRRFWWGHSGTRAAVEGHSGTRDLKRAPSPAGRP